jgi:Zn-finger nucleic acid-binding protein
MGTDAKLNASRDESYCLVGVGVDRGELEELLAKKGKPEGLAWPERGMCDGRL